MYQAIVNIVRFVLLIINGRIHSMNKDLLPQDSNYVLVAPHRSLIDPVPIALAGFPHEYSFMVKEELRSNRLMNYLIDRLNFVSVNRDNPGPSALKDPIRILKEGQKSFMLFPTGSRYSDDMKDGAVTIARLSGKNIVPAVYDGPLTIKDIFKRQRMTVAYGQPITIENSKDKDQIKAYNQQIQDAFDRIQANITQRKIKHH